MAKAGKNLELVLFGAQCLLHMARISIGLSPLFIWASNTQSLNSLSLSFVSCEKRGDEKPIP